MPPSLRHRIGYEGAMGFGPNYRCIIGVFAAWLACSLVALAAAPADPAAMAQYYGLLEQYNQAHAPYAAAASAYWSSISEKRKLRNTKRARDEDVSLDDYVLAQPPVYTGPPKPRNPALPPPPPPPRVPIVADFLAAALAEFQFSPRLPPSDGDFKLTYATLAKAAGLTKDQVVRIYSFEATGNGDYQIEAGLEYNKHARAVSTALGYNQLLGTNSVEIVAEDGNRFADVLHTQAAQLPADQRQTLERKIGILRKMIVFAKSVPDDWGQHEILANTQKGLGVHALNLDLDVGPLLQTQKLLDSVFFARRKGITTTLTAAELEMMNLTGDGNGFDMVTMPLPWRDKVPTSNFFQPSGYADNPVVQRNNVVLRLLAATNTQMDTESKKPGAKELAEAFQ
jgi:hypothetical protein